jgi:hypothetical protein
MADPVAEMRLADANRRKAALLNGVLMISGDAAAIFIISLGLGAASTLRSLVVLFVTTGPYGAPGWLRSLQTAAFVCWFGQHLVILKLVDVHEK